MILYPKLVATEHFIPNFEHKNTVYLKLNTPIYCIPPNPGRPSWVYNAVESKDFEKIPTETLVTQLHYAIITTQTYVPLGMKRNL